MKVLAVGDPHAKNDNQEDIIQLTSEIVRVHTEHNTDAITILGDLSHFNDKISIYAEKSIRHLFYRLNNLGVPIIYIIGNHDLPNNSEYLSDRHFFNLYKGLANVIIVDTKPHVLGDYIFCPYVYPGRFKEALSLVPGWEKYKTIFAHQEFKGVSFNGGHTSTIGDSWEESLPLVVSGHIHERQMLQNNVHYTGSSTQTNFGESNDKYLSIVEGTAVTSVKINVPLKYTIQFDIKDVKSVIDTREINPLHKVRFSITTSSSDMAIFKKSDNYRTLCDIGKVVFKITDTLIKVSQKDKPKGFNEILREKLLKESMSVREIFNEINS
jgi:DNA repair exonuclease SbcCD nuclease subunit